LADPLREKDPKGAEKGLKEKNIYNAVDIGKVK